MSTDEPPPMMKRSMLAPHGPCLAPKFEQEDAWQEFCDRTAFDRIHDFGRYWWSYGRDEGDDGFLREAVFLEVPLRKDVQAKHIRAKLTCRHLTLSDGEHVLIDEDFEEQGWLNASDSFWEIEVKDVKKVRRKVLRYVLYVIMNCEKYITKWLFASERQEDDGRFLDQDEEADTVHERLRVIGAMREPEPRRDADIWFSETEEEEERWCDGCSSTRVVVMKRPEDSCYMKYCNDCPFVSPAKHADLPTGLAKQRSIDEKRERKRRLRARKEEARRRAEAARSRAEGDPDRSEEVPEDYRAGEKTRMMTDEQFCNELQKAVERGDIKWEDD
eukprot:TRINITY_DN27301_c0_g1_i1.p1 TRINITY_DN27301_c0_g1~~TRINITY_DN27301_c0_g1_i1.p1  ORF type:complete len:359 (-),score=86.59 TRINITY_DN27301_c0_g1_i1:57-1046(-)